MVVVWCCSLVACRVVTFHAGVPHERRGLTGATLPTGATVVVTVAMCRLLCGRRVVGMTKAAHVGRPRSLRWCAVG